MSGIALFLTRRLYGPEQHSRGWDKYVYDDENVHYALLHLLCETSNSFAAKFLGLPGRTHPVSVVLEPERGLFDLLFVTGGANHYCEVKVWADLSETQFLRQAAFLKAANATGIYLLSTKAADAWSRQRVLAASEGRSRVVGVAELLDMLGSLERDLPPDVSEVAEAYREALTSLNTRWPAAGRFGASLVKTNSETEQNR